jgi:hypothetical protein
VSRAAILCGAVLVMVVVLIIYGPTLLMNYLVQRNRKDNQ